LFGSVLRRAGVPLAMGVHTLIPHTSRLENWARRVPLDGVFANSAFTAASARNWYPGHADVTVIHLPVEVPATLASEARLRLRESLGAAPGDCVILQASRMQALKGQRTLLTALVELKDVPGWVCWLVGGAQRSEEEALVVELQSLARQHGLPERIRFLGQRNDIGALLQAADLVCQVNQDPEAFGLIYVEAMGAGRPVIAANQGGVTEVVDASCGALIAPGDSAALATLLQRWIADPELRRELGAAGIDRARQRCDPEQQLRVLSKFFRSLVASRLG
jgi:glycosyltransferase involved in cell wall biosynthesis